MRKLILKKRFACFGHLSESPNWLFKMVISDVHARFAKSNLQGWNQGVSLQLKALKFGDLRTIGKTVKVNVMAKVSQ